MCITDRPDMTLAIIVALNPNHHEWYYLAMVIFQDQGLFSNGLQHRIDFYIS